MKLKEQQQCPGLSPAIPAPHTLLLSWHILICTCSVKLGQFETSPVKKEEQEPKPGHWEALQWFPHFIWAHSNALARLVLSPGSLHQCYHLLYLLKVHKSLENS